MLFTFDITNDLPDFDDRRVGLQRRIVIYLDMYTSVKFDLFPNPLDKRNKLKSKDEWAKELDELFCLRMDKVINKIGYAWWETTIEELVKVQLLFDSLKQDFVNIDKEVEGLIKKTNDILQFNQPNDTLFYKWMVDIASKEQWVEGESDGDEMDQDEVQIIEAPSTDQKKEEDKDKKPIAVVGKKAQNDDMAQEEERINVVFLVLDGNRENT